MAIPKYDEMYRDFLDCLADGQLHRSREIKDRIADKHRVSADERLELLPSGRQPVYDNRVGWTRTYLKKAGLIESPARGVFVLTTAGKAVLQADPAVLDNRYLERFESFRAFRGLEGTQAVAAAPEGQGQSPQDTLDHAYGQIRAALADELMDEIMKRSPAFFEGLVVRLLERMGYGGSVRGAGMVVGQSGDEGIDGIIREDKLGFSLIYIQAKRWERGRTVSRPEIQKFVGALAGQGAGKGLFITTAQFTKEAQTYAGRQHTTKVVLVDGAMLASLMIEHGLGVSTEAVYEIKKLDSDFFSEDED